MFTISWLVEVSSTNKPLAGLLIDVMEAVPILGISNPLLVLFKSSIALASGVALFMPTDCAWQTAVITEKNDRSSNGRSIRKFLSNFHCLPLLRESELAIHSN
jgi:hypothetical protein